MTSRAILIGNAKYKNLAALPCCRDDVNALHQLLSATGKYEDIEIVEDADADTLKERIRQLADRGQPVEEFFFYFTGHGYQHEAEFYFCATNFDAKAPNQTGLSTTELHTLLRLAEADVVVKVIDACHSGALLVKASDALGRQPKDGFKSIVQIASCMDDQGALTGDPLSLFTEQFRNAALRKKDGVIYYTDIIDALRDEFIDNHTQTPHFIAQGTGREQFVEDARRLDGLRTSLAPPPAPPTPPAPAPPQPSALDLLTAAETRAGTRAAIKQFTDALFDGLKSKLTNAGSSEYFDLATVEHSDYDEPTTRGFIIRCLAKEERPDDFVTAEITRERKRQPGWQLSSSLLHLSGLWDDTEVVETYDLRLNCKMERAQLKVTLTPKFVSMRRIVLVASCAPSLESCYVFELATVHTLRDFGDYNTDGPQIYRHWHVRKWGHDPKDLVDKLALNLTNAADSEVKATLERLTKK